MIYALLYLYKTISLIIQLIFYVIGNFITGIMVFKFYKFKLISIISLLGHSDVIYDTLEQFYMIPKWE